MRLTPVERPLPTFPLVFTRIRPCLVYDVRHNFFASFKISSGWFARFYRGASQAVASGLIATGARGANPHATRIFHHLQ